jgi:hypothetical protein
MDEDQIMDEDRDSPDTSHDLDMVPLFASSNHKAEMEAIAIHSLLTANGIPAVIVGPSVIPSLEFQVQVPRNLLEEARRTIEEAKAAGPEAADEAELASE